MGKCPHKSPSPCNIYVTPMSLYKFVSSYVTKMRVVSSSFRSGRNCRWGEWITSALFHLQYHDWGALEQGTEPQLLPGHCSINSCPLLRVCVHDVCVCVCSLLCVHFGWVNADRAQIQSMGITNMSHHFHFFYFLKYLEDQGEYITRGLSAVLDSTILSS